MNREIGQPSRQPFFEAEKSFTATTDILTRYGTVRICWNGEAVVSVVIGPFDPEDRRTTVRRFLPPHAAGQELIAGFLNYFVGKPVDFNVPLPPDVGTEFQCAVWAAVKDIPYGHYETYGELALRMGLPLSRSRHVGNAVGQNPLPVAFPCHRVVAPTGALTGYAAGAHWKKALLELEGVIVQNDRVPVRPQEE